MGGWTHPLPQPLPSRSMRARPSCLRWGPASRWVPIPKPHTTQEGFGAPLWGSGPLSEGQRQQLSCSLEPPEEAGRTPCGGKHLEAGGKCEAEARPAP